MKFYCGEDYKAMSRIAANIISAQIIMKPDCVLGLATGSSPEGTYAQLVEWYKKGEPLCQTDWSRTARKHAASMTLL